MSYLLHFINETLLILFNTQASHNAYHSILWTHFGNSCSKVLTFKENI